MSRVIRLLYSRLLLLPPLRPPVLEPNLNASLGQVDPQRQLLPEENVRVVSLMKRSLELFQLVIRKGRPSTENVEKSPRERCR